MKCGHCGFDNPNDPRFRFCGQCGNRLDGTVSGADAARHPSDAGARPVPRRGGAERRHLTVMFCDLVGSTALSQSVDPEDYREIMGTYRATANRVVAGHEGYVAQFYGDGILVYFGYPSAHEDDAQRAVRAGLELIDVVADLDHDAGLSVRVGIHSGLVVVGQEHTADVLNSEDAIGGTPNIAARIQAAAAPNTVFVSAATHRLIAGYFDCVGRGSQDLRGVDAPMPIFEVHGSLDVATRLDAVGRALTPLVGRTHEIEAIAQAWDRTQEGRGGTIILTGDPGIGKSRVIAAVRAQFSAQEFSWLRHYCSTYHSATAFHPLIRALERRLGFSREMKVGEKQARLERMLSHFGLDVETHLPAFAALLSVPVDDRFAVPATSGIDQKERKLESLCALLLAIAARKPVLIVLEDAHWIDPSTAAFFERVIELAPAHRILLLIAHRADYESPWHYLPNVAHLPLKRLDNDQATAIVNGIEGAARLPAEIIAKIVKRADGVPIFLEEVTRMLLQRDPEQDPESADNNDRHPVLAVPETLQDSLMARLDGLGAAKDVAQLASVIGRTFNFDVLASVASLAEPALRGALAQLVNAGIISKRRTTADESYVFRHALIHDVAYESLLRRKRQQYHHTIGDTLATKFPGIAEATPGTVARHYAAAGLLDKALTYCIRAAERSVRSAAMAEALSETEKGLGWLETLPSGRAEKCMELRLRSLRAGALAASHGYAAPQVRLSLDRVLALAEELGDDRQTARALLGFYSHNLSTGRAREARHYAERLMALSERVDDSEITLAANTAVGVCLYDHGEIVKARAYLERASLMYRPSEAGQILGSQLNDLGVVCRSVLALVLWYLGYPDQAARAADSALEAAEHIGHPFSLAFALSVGGSVYARLGQWDVLKARAERSLAISTQHNFPTWRVHSMIHRGWAMVETGDIEAGLAEIDRGFEAGAPMWQRGPSTFYSASRATALCSAGRYDAAHDAIVQGLDRLTGKGGRAIAPELYRLRGELRLAAGTRGVLPNSVIDAAKKDLCSALQSAREQGEKSLELRAATSLARLRHAQGETPAAICVLKPVYDWFSEGFTSPDLIGAADLLHQLQAGAVPIRAAQPSA